jgi:hypothetical protein
MRLNEVELEKLVNIAAEDIAGRLFMRRNIAQGTRAELRDRLTRLVREAAKRERKAIEKAG